MRVPAAVMGREAKARGVTEDELGRLTLEMARALQQLEPESEARRRNLGQRIVKLLGPATRLGAEADRLVMTQEDRLRLCLGLLKSLRFARWQGDPETLPPFAEWLAEHREETKAGRGQREDRRTRDGFLAAVAIVLTGSGVPVTTYAAEADRDGRPPGAWAEAVSGLAPWAGVELPGDPRELRRLLAAVLKRADVRRPRGRLPRRR